MPRQPFSEMTVPAPYSSELDVDLKNTKLLICYFMHLHNLNISASCTIYLFSEE